MMQGDAYDVPVEILLESGPASNKDFIDVEISVGKITKTMSSGEIRYNEEKKSFMFPLTQDETFNLMPGSHEAQARVMFNNHDIVGVDLGSIEITKSISKGILK